MIGCGASRRSRADARSYRALRLHSGEGVVTAETIGNTLDTDSPAHQTRAPAHHATKHAEPATFFADGLIHWAETSTCLHCSVPPKALQSGWHRSDHEFHQRRRVTQPPLSGPRSCSCLLGRCSWKVAVLLVEMIPSYTLGSGRYFSLRLGGRPPQLPVGTWP